MRMALWRFFGPRPLRARGLGAGGGGGAAGGGAPPPGAAPPAAPPPAVVMQTFAYVSGSGLNAEDIRIYRVEDGGALVSVDLVPAGEGVLSLAIHPSNRFAYAVNRGDRSVSAFRLDPGTGRLTGRVDVTTGSSPRQIRIHPSGNFAYVTNFVDGSISIFDIDSGTGALTANPAGPVTVGAEASGLMIEPRGRFLFVESVAGVQSYLIEASGALSLNDTEPIAATLNDIALAPSGRFLYAAAADGTVSMHPISDEGVVGSGAMFTVGAAGDSTIYIEPRGRFAYVTNSSNNTVAAFGLHPQTGELIPAGPASAVTDPSAVAMGPTGEVLYVTSQADATISLYSVNQTTGALMPAGSPVSTDGLLTGITIASFPR